MAEAFEEAYLRRFAFLMPDKPIIVEAVSVEADGALRARREARPRTAAAARGRRRHGRCRPVFTGGRWAHGWPLTGARTWRRATRVDGPGDHRRGQRHHGGRAGLAGDRDDLATWCSAASARPRGAAARSAPAPTRSGWRSSTTCSCRSPSRWACRCRAPRTRSTSRSGWTSPARSSTPSGGLVANAPHMPVHLGSMGASVQAVIDRRARRDASPATPSRSTTPTPAAPTCRTSPWSCRCSADASGDPTCSSSPPAATTPTSAASRPAPCRRFSTRIDEEGVLLDNWLLVERGRLREAETAHAAARRAAIPPRNPEQNIADLRAQIAACDEGRAGAASAWCEHFGLDVVRPTWATCRTTPRKPVRRVDRRAAGRRSSPTSSTAARRSWSRYRRPRSARRRVIDFTGTCAQLPANFNAPSSVCDGRGALRLPHPGRRRHPAQRRLPEAAARSSSRRARC